MFCKFQIEDHCNVFFLFMGSPNNTITCSGRGDCICGECECYTISLNTPREYSGEFCECNDYSCSFGPNGLCGGLSSMLHFLVRFGRRSVLSVYELMQHTFADLSVHCDVIPCEIDDSIL